MGEPKPKRVLIAMDGSPNAEYAFEWYVRNVHRAENRVIVVHCPEYKSLHHTPILSADVNLIKNLISEEENRIRLLTAKLNEQIQRAELDGKVVTCPGQPGHSIVKTAEEQEVDFIVTGCRGLGAIRRTFIGSVSDYVVHHSDVPVMVVQYTRNEGT